MSGLQSVLAAEHAAVYLYGVLGARAGSEAGTSSLNAPLRYAYDAHVAARNALTEQIRATGAVPVGPAAAYAIPRGWAGEAALRAGALDVERRCAAVYISQVGAVTGADRRLLATGAAACAVRELAFGGAPGVTPGL